MTKKEQQQLILNEYNQEFGTSYNTYDELLEELNEAFDRMVDRYPDVQEAYDYLDDEYNGFIGKHFVFFSTDGPWHVDHANELSADTVRDATSAINSYYSQNFDEDDIDGATSYLEHQVGKAMSNCGADPKTSLDSVLGDLAIDDGVFKIIGFEGPFELGIL